MFRRAVALRPSATNLTHLAEVLVIRGEFAAAKRLLQRAVRIGSDDLSMAYYQLGLVARARRQYADALKNFQTAIRYSPEYPLAAMTRRDVREAMKVSGSKEIHIVSASVDQLRPDVRPRTKEAHFQPTDTVCAR